MKKILLLVLLAWLAGNNLAQVKKSNNSGLDSLKQSVKDLGRVFKKSSEISLQVKDVAANDNQLAALIKSIRQVRGVTRIKEQQYRVTEAAFSIYYKGDGTELWSYIPGSNKLPYELQELNDSAIVLINKSAKQTKPPVETVSSKTVTATENGADNNKKNQAVPSGTEKQADPAVLTKGAALLFGTVKSKLSIMDKNLLFKQLGFRISKDGKQFVLEGGEDFPFAATVYPVDMNKDGIEEIFVFFGNGYTSGMTGSSIALFVADSKGEYKSHLGFPGTLPDLLTTSNLGYPDLLIGGPGFEFPVQRWDGKTYNYHRKVKDKDYEKTKKTNLEELSRGYVDTIK